MRQWGQNNGKTVTKWGENAEEMDGKTVRKSVRKVTTVNRMRKTSSTQREGKLETKGKGRRGG